MPRPMVSDIIFISVTEYPALINERLFLLPFRIIAAIESLKLKDRFSVIKLSGSIFLFL